MRTRTRLALLTAPVLLVALACETDLPTETVQAKAGGTSPLTVTPTALTFQTTNSDAATLTASVQFVGIITATTSAAACATVSPGSVPATKPRGSSLYVATFSVQPVGVGTCTITVTDKQGRTARIPVEVQRLGLPGRLTWNRVSTETTNRTSQVYFMPRIGASPVLLTPAGRTDFHPTLSPDGTRIAFMTVVSGGRNLAVMNTDGSGFATVVFGLNIANPSWSPDGSRIAYGTGICCGNDIAVVNVDGTGNQVLTSDGRNGEPSWSPDGTTIAFTSSNAGHFEIHLMDPDGSNRRVLAVDGDVPAWSPDGTRIAFESLRDDGDAEIYVMNADGTNQTRLTTSPGSDYAPAWSPDGGMIAFETDRDGNREIYAMNADGTGLQNLTNHPEIDAHASWR
jgi:Tol biopolymer transport system component